MPSGHSESYDFFLSRRGSVAAIAREVTDVLIERGYKVLVQDYDIPLGASFIEAMHEAVKNSRDLVILFTRDYEQSPYTRKEFTSFEADRHQSAEERHIIVLRCEDVPLRGLLADNVYQDLVGVAEPEERKRRIIAAAERQSQAAAPPPRPFIGVPPRIASFTGRADELDRLDAILMHDRPAAVTQTLGRAAVQGMGGVGKTSLAIEYAHRYRKLYAGVCWCPAETRTGLLSSLAQLGAILGFGSDEADLEKTSKAALRRLSEQRATWLLIYDNVKAPDDLTDLLPSAGACVIITSRFCDWAEMAEEVPVDVMPHEQATSFLQSRAGRSDPPGARTLVDAVGCLPLALDHAGALCKRTQMPFAGYAANVEKLIASAPRAAGYPRSVAATFELAVSEAVTQCPGTDALMAYVGYCAPERIPMTLLEGAIEEGERLQAIAALAEVSLIKHDPFEDGTPAVTVHRLVQSVARTRAAATGQSEAAVDRLVVALAATYPNDAYHDPKSWLLCARLTPHLLALRKVAPDGEPKNLTWPNLLIGAASYFHGRAVYLEAERFFREALAIRKNVLGTENVDTAAAMNDLAILLREKGDLAEARMLFERALAIKEKSLDPEHPSIATGLNNLAHLLNDQHDLAGARLLYERALAIRERVLGSENPLTVQSLSNLAGVFHEQGDTAGAKRLYKRASEIYQKVLGPNHPDTGMSLGNLGALLYDEGDLVGAQPLFEGALAINEKTLGLEHPETARSLNNLASLLRAAGQHAEAEKLFGRAIQIAEKALGAEHTLTQLYRRNFARLLVAAVRPVEALPLGRNRARGTQERLRYYRHLDQRQRPRHCRRARRAWPRRGGEAAAGTVWAHGA